MKSTDMSLAEIAEYVGYNSYCGFWKAYKKYQAAENDTFEHKENKPAPTN